MENKQPEPPVYRVKRAAAEHTPDADWSSPFWQGVQPLDISVFPWDQGGHRPRTQVRLQCTSSHLHIIFRVEDRYVRCQERPYNGPVCQDACVEFFFQPAPVRSTIYFNIETNCCGGMLFQRQAARLTDVLSVSEEDASLLDLAVSLPEVVEPEVESPLTWCNEYRIPFSLLAPYAPVDPPAPGVQWRANFYKCAESNSHPHYGCWAPIRWPEPDYHRPEFFGILAFL